MTLALHDEFTTHDLRVLLRNVGGIAGGGPGLVGPQERETIDTPVDILDDAAELDCDPMPVTAFIDGIQSAVLLGYREHRPMYLRYIAAGAVGHGGGPIGCAEQLEVACGVDDADWMRDMAGTIPVRELPGETPDDIIRAAVTSTGDLREALERDLAVQLLPDAEHALVCDGSLVGRPAEQRLCGVVKDTSRRYLEDERVLWRIKPGWRSPRFKIHAGVDMGVARYSCYVRLHSNERQRWNFGLVRVEAFDPDLLDGLAMRAFVERQAAGARDARWERHIAPVRMVEDFLRGRRPAVFTGGVA